jgi:hypothetical protein
MKQKSTTDDNFTEIYMRLPLGPGVPSPSLTGFDFAPIESRKPVEKDLRDFINFCRRDATSLNVKIIKAEWGEGKTDAYERYILPEIEKKGDACYFVSTSTLIDKIKRFDAIFPTTKYVTSSKFLASLFVAIIDEAYSQGINITTFPNPSKFQNDPLGFIEKSLRNHVEKGLKKIFVFIDEFEELLIHEPEVQRQIISGIKELVNGQLGLIHENGEYSGILHFFIACTPYAYNRIMDSIELGQMTGSVKSRFTTTTLPEIGKKEALQFLVDLTRFCYKGRIPDVFPFRTSGPLNGIYTISHGNLREMIKLFVKLMSTAADEKEKRLRIIDYEHFLDALRDEEIAIYGAAGRAIDVELFDRIIASMNNWKRGEECKKVLCLLIGELKPFSLNEIARRVKVPPDDVHELVAKINDELRKMGIEKTITPLMPLYNDKTFETVKGRLNVAQNQIIVGESQIPLKRFEEKLTFYDVQKDGTIVGFAFLPKEIKDLHLMFEELTEDEAENLYRSIYDLFDLIGSNRYYVLSQEFANQIFPSPIWLLMDFVKDRTKRMDLWRKASKEFVESLKELKEGVLDLIEHANLGKFEPLTERGPKHYKFYFKLPPDKTIEVYAYVHVSTGSITAQDISEISKDIRAYRPNLIILIYTGEVEAILPSSLDGIENAFLQLHFRKLRALQLIVAQLAKKEGVVDERILEARLREIMDDAEVRERLFECYNKCKTAGIVVDDLYTYYAESGSKLAGILKYYINFLGSQKTSADIFSDYEKTLKKIKFFGDKEVPFAPVDIESEGEFVKYEDELIKNGFITKHSNLTVYVEQTPIEKRLIAIIKKYPKMPLSQLRKYFINAAQAENILEKVYLPLLEHKGLIEIKDDEVLAVDLNERKRRLEENFANYKISLKSKPPHWRSFAKICVSKGGKGGEREMTIIDLDFFDQLIQQVIETIEAEHDESVICQKIKLATLLLDYYYQNLEPKVETAYKASLELRKRCDEEVENVRTALDKVLNAYNSYCATRTYSLPNIEEFDKLSEIIGRFYKTFETIFTLGELHEIYKGFRWDEFHFRAREPSEAHFFNLKYAKLEKIYKEFSDISNFLNTECQTIERSLTEAEELRKQIQKEIARYAIPSKYAISFKIMELLQKYQSKPLEAQSALPKIKINIIKEFFTTLTKQLNKDQNKVQQILSKVDSIKKSEKNFLESNLKERFEVAKDFFVGAYEKEFGRITEAINTAFENYASQLSLVNNQSAASLDDLFNLVDSTEKRFRDVIDVKYDEAEEIIKSIFEDAKLALSSIRSEIKDFLTILKKGLGENAHQICNRYSEEFDTEIEITIGAIKTVKEGGKTAYNWRDRLKQLATLRDNLFKDLKPILPEEQGTLLLEVVRILQEKGTKWIDMILLKSELKERLGLSEDRTDILLKDLAKMNLLKEGASLPV